jgi:hypothetical protein
MQSFDASGPIQKKADDRLRWFQHRVAALWVAHVRGAREYIKTDQEDVS